MPGEDSRNKTPSNDVADLAGPARRDGVDPDAVGVVLDGQRSGGGGQAALGQRGEDRGRAGVRTLAEGGQNVDHVAAVSLGHLVDGTLGKPEEAGQVDPDGRCVVGGGVVGERLGDRHASVVDQGVDAAKASQGCIDDPLGGSALGNVCGDGDQIGVLRRLDPTGARHHPPALPPIPGDKPGADIPGASRDDGDLARHDAASLDSTGAGKTYFDIAALLTRPEECIPLRSRLGATDCACEDPGRVPWSATSRWHHSPGRHPEWAGHEP